MTTNQHANQPTNQHANQPGRQKTTDVMTRNLKNTTKGRKMFRAENFRKEVLSYYLQHIMAYESFELDGEVHTFTWAEPQKGVDAVVSRYSLPDIEEDPRQRKERLKLLKEPQEYLDELVRRAYA